MSQKHSPSKVLFTRDQSGNLEWVQIAKARGLMAESINVLEFSECHTDESRETWKNTHFDRIVLTSGQAFRFLQKLVGEHLLALRIKKVPILAIGKKTASFVQAQNMGFSVLFPPTEGDGVAFAEWIVKNDFGKSYLLPASEDAKDEIEKILRQNGRVVTRLDLYRPVPAKDFAQSVQALLVSSQVDWIVFASGSAAQIFLSELKKMRALDWLRNGPKLAVLGKSAKMILEQSQIQVHWMPPIPDIHDLLKGIQDYRCSSDSIE